MTIIPTHITAFAQQHLQDSLSGMTAFVNDPTKLDVLSDMAGLIVDSFYWGGKLMIAGNGGSAGDSQHLAAEFVVRLLYDRRPLPAMALTVDGSSMTACGNDYSFDAIFERQVRALGRAGDVFLGISTSGRSRNVLRAAAAAREIGMKTIAFSGEAGMDSSVEFDKTFAAPSAITAVVQQCHITAAHALCAMVERTLCPPSP